ncbi:TfoX/Sxy family protein [Abyssibacter profundi]|uniref:Transcriptional regulator n=1 Tax=Abyssibacter profundi TaxID=2182787 RepID=A0A363ULS3_9GAMM|nr:TfoX/Sxy family protein [Abyssibacter profundi]PWN56363.1 transcriptional regulator [Abyssibacter profundi]
MSAFVDYLHEVFAEFGAIRMRRMFGGYGVYHADRMFALIADDTLYLKVDAQTQADFDALDLPAFEFAQRGRVVQMSYRLAPDEIFDDPQLAAEWARRAYGAAVRASGTG